MNSKTCYKTLPVNGQLKQFKTAEEHVVAGEFKLIQGFLSEALHHFNLADELDKNNPQLVYRQALALFEYGSNDGMEQTLLLASKKFKAVSILTPENCDVFHAWGNTLTLLGESLEQHHFFLEAKEKYEKAFQLGQTSSDLQWDYGVIWYYIGQHSEEALDFRLALQSFEKAAKEGSQFPSEFWIDYGVTALILSQKINDSSQIVKAINCFKHAISQNESCFISWSHLAEALQMLYEHTHDEDHFAQANECFETASKICPQDGQHWLEWAKFLIDTSQRNGDVKKLRNCLDKCHHSYACDPDNPETLAIWAEALALLGQQTERLDLIFEAENKISEALELCDDDPNIWHSYGTCYSAFGAYFKDYDYYYQAIEKFQAGLSIDRTCYKLWHAIARTYARVGNMESDTEAILQSLNFFSKALNFSNSSSIHIDYALALAKLGEITGDKLHLETAVQQFEYAFSRQKNAIYLQPDWIFSYACCLDLLGDFYDEKSYYTRAIEIFTHVLMLDPDYPEVHHRLAQAFCHLGEMLGDVDCFYRAIQYLRLALKNDEDNDSMILDWGITLINISEHQTLNSNPEQLLYDAQQKLTLAAKLGNLQAYYQLSCLYSLTGRNEEALYFLQKADQFNALPPIEEMLYDDWLEGVRCTHEFREFLSLLESRPNLQEER